MNEKANESLQKFDLSPAREFLLPDWGRRSLSAWVHHKFAMAVDPASWADIDRAEIVRRVQAMSRDLYAQKEAELPARIAMIKYLGDRSNHQNPRYDREGLAAWASERYHTAVTEDELRTLLRPEIEERLIGLAHQNDTRARGWPTSSRPSSRRPGSPAPVLRRTGRRPIRRPWPSCQRGPNNP